MIATYILDIIVVLALAILVITIGTRLKIPGVVGFLLTGIVVGPYGLGLVKDAQMVEVLAEIGIIFLLFTIGMQFSFKTLFEMKKIVLVAGNSAGCTDHSCRLCDHVLLRDTCRHCTVFRFPDLP